MGTLAMTRRVNLGESQLLTGPGRRGRRWSADEKAQIVAETLAPGGRVSEVARRWQVCSQQVFGWRRAMRQAVTTAPTKERRPWHAVSFRS